MPSFDSETTELWRHERVAGHCCRNQLKALFKRELKKFEQAALDDPEAMAQWLLGRHSEHSIVQQCANKLGEKWLAGQQDLIDREARYRKRLVLEQKLEQRLDELINTDRHQ
jgi:hypothetical protein